MKLWVGREEEGVHKGLGTLFVGSPKITFHQIKYYVNEYKVSQLYFGAGVCTKINYKIVDKCKKYFNDFITITLEVDINKFNYVPPTILRDKSIEFIITITNKNYTLLKQLNEYKVQIKIQSLEPNNKIVALSDWATFKQVNIKNLKGKMYKGDVVIID